MEPTTILVFTSMSCPHCPAAKREVEKLDRDDVEIHYLGMETDEGQEYATQFGIKSVPTIVLYGPCQGQPIGLRGAHSVASLEKHINATRC